MRKWHIFPKKWYHFTLFNQQLGRVHFCAFLPTLNLCLLPLKCAVPKCAISICIFMMTNGFKNLFVYLLYSLKYLYSNPSPFFYWIVVLLSFKSPYIVDRSPLSVVCVADIFSESDLVFSFLMIFFEQKKFVILAKFIYEKFLNNLLFVFCTSNLFLPQVHENFFQCC